jgi:hypothetical protein
MKRLKILKRPIEIQYFVGSFNSRPLAKGFTTASGHSPLTRYENAMGTIGRHLARTDWYPKAAIIDRETGRLVATARREGNSIVFKERQ